MNWLAATGRRVRARLATDAGNAIIEFVFVAVTVLVPLVYLIVAVATVQRNSLAVTAAAREAGRAYATADTPAEAGRRADVAVRLALADQGLRDAQVRVVSSGTSCNGPAVLPALQPGTEYTVCVTRQVDLPGVPGVLEGRGVTTVGRFVVHVDDFRVPPPGFAR